MDEFISKKLLVAKFNELASKYIDGDKRQRGLAYATAADMIALADAADVQSANQWVSVKDRLPEPEKEVLVWYRYTWGAGFTAYRFGISRWYSNIKRWYEGCLPKDIEVLYWQPLPEPPKDGESNG